ncbi:TIE1 [Lepeophtheirus salmonis]|uniref:TIE1 n=1 Tax=Lepeophtheirus salmonis TaxID=72036 RepID=A0A7R8CN50_LEPSM|nr:TIE1 [Lepeophtheirus salmonis]CAF2871716.1 TIE1 [Lepeophtheirus salmonis]
MQAKLAVYEHGLSEDDSKLNKYKDLIEECAEWEDISIEDLLESQNYKKCVELKKSIQIHQSSRRTRIDVSLKPKHLEVNDSLIEFKNWMKAFRRFYSSNLMSKLLLDEQRGYLDNCLSSSCRGNLEQFLDMGDIQSINACLMRSMGITKKNTPS